MRRSFLLGLLLIPIVLLPASAQVAPYARLNGSLDDYAIAFRSTATGMQIWYTTTRSAGGRGSRRMMAAQFENGAWRAATELPAPVNQVPADTAGAQYLDGAPAFALCRSGCAVFTSNRPDANGRQHDNDLYELAMKGGAWNVRRIDAVNSDAWDDSPALSPDGSTLYFASNRRSPMGRETDIYMSRRSGSGWSAPELVADINADGVREQTPFVSPDGYLYYATDVGGDFDIWRARLNLSTGAVIPGTKARVELPEVNRAGSDEVHPAITPGGGWLMFTSNRGAAADYDIYYCRVGSPDTLAVKVLLRTRREIGGMMVDVTEPLAGVRLSAADPRTGGTAGDVRAAGAGAWQIVPPPSSDPADDRLMGEVVIRAEGVAADRVSSVDTVRFRRGTTCTLTHTLLVWDARLLVDGPCSQDFQVQRVEFFVKGYWCPTSVRYGDLAPCTSVLSETGGCVEVQQPVPACDANELYSYALAPARVAQVRQPDLCIRWDEVTRHSTEWGERVDRAIDTLVDNMRAGIRQYCVQRALGEHRPVTVEVIGWTDPDPIMRHCRYTGPDIAFTGDIRLAGMENMSWIKNGVLEHNTVFRDSPMMGNQLLSDLRAYMMATLLDRLWRREIPDYANFRASGAITLVARGAAVSHEQGRSKEQQRAIDVIITADLGEHKSTPGTEARVPVTTEYLCGADCIDEQPCW